MKKPYMVVFSHGKFVPAAQSLQVTERHVIKMKQKITITAICLAIVLLAAKVIMSDDVVNAKESRKTDTVQILSRDEILNAQEADYKNVSYVKWQEYDASDATVQDGVIPVNLLSDEIYCSMNLPSESRSNEMIQMNRDNGKIMSGMTSKQSSIVGIGAIYSTAGADLPDQFTLCIGKIKTFAYLDSIDNWAIIDEQPYPDGVYLYKMPWTEHKSKKCNNIQYYSDHVEISLTKEEFTSYALHFWGKRKAVDRKDVRYVACAYDFWIKETGNDGKFTAAIGIDAKDKKGSSASIVQLFSSRGMQVTSQKRTQWGQTIPNAEYDSVYDGYVLKLLYDKWWSDSK